MTNECLVEIQKRHSADPNVAQLISEFLILREQIARWKAAETRRYSKEKTKSELVLKMEVIARERDQALRDCEELKIEILKLKGEKNV